jgi:hypothetical protein
MKFVVQILIEEENVLRNFGCVMVIGRKCLIKRRNLDFNLMDFSDCDNGSDEEQRYCGMFKKSFRNFFIYYFL